MNSNERRRIYRRWLKAELRERCIDLAYFAFPVFAVTGVGAVAVKFWSWVLGL